MKFNYHSDTDSLYIDLSEKASEDSQEVSPGIVLDFDDEGRLVGIDIQHASQSVNFSRIDDQTLPVKRLTLTQP